MFKASLDTGWYRGILLEKFGVLLLPQSLTHFQCLEPYLWVLSLCTCLWSHPKFREMMVLFPAIIKIIMIYFLSCNPNRHFCKLSENLTQRGQRHFLTSVSDSKSKNGRCVHQKCYMHKYFWRERVSLGRLVRTGKGCVYFCPLQKWRIVWILFEFLKISDTSLLEASLVSSNFLLIHWKKPLQCRRLDQATKTSCCFFYFCCYCVPQ